MSAAIDIHAERGRKHRCAACGAAFYDMTRELTACPKCETPYAAALMPAQATGRKRQSWATKRPAEPKPEVESAAADDGAEAILDKPDDAEAEADDDVEALDAEESPADGETDADENKPARD
jgi:hypothetical protein